MDGFSGDDIWRSVPPEEKFQILAQAHAAGVVSAVITIIICSTIAIGLKMSWLLWGSVICSPFIFQFAAGKKWRDVRPRVMLEYLAARSAARRFAFSARGKDLTCKFMFRGKLEQVFDEGAMQEALEALIQNNKEAQVWVALFGDSVVMMEERLGGAEARYAQLIDSKLSLESHALDGKGDYSSNKELIFKTSPKGKPSEKFRLTSPYPAALVVFEKKLKQQIQDPGGSGATLALNDKFDDKGDDSMDSGVMMFN
jgi:hypothetical protein